MSVLGKHFQPSLMFVGKARSLPLSGARERCFTQVGQLALDKHSNLFTKIRNLRSKKFYDIRPRREKMAIRFNSA